MANPSISIDVDKIRLEDDLPEYDTVMPVDRPQADRAAKDAALYNTFINDSDSPGEDFERVRREIVEQGRSEDVETTKQELGLANQQIVVDQALDIASTLPNKEDQKRVLDAANKVDAKNKVDLATEYALKEAAEYQPEHPQNQEVQENLLVGIDDLLITDDEIQRDIRDYMATLSTNLGQTAPDVAASLVPFNTAETYHSIIADVFGEEEASKAFLVAPGEGLRFIKEQLWNTVDEDERRALAKELMESINKNAGLLDDNHFLRWITTMEIFENILNPSSSINDTDWDRIINNTVGILDYLAVGSLIKGVYRAGKAVSLSKSTPIGITSHVSPKKAEEMVASAMVEPSGKVADAIGTTKTELAESAMYPKPLGMVEHQKMPAAIREVIDQVQTAAASIVERTESFGFAYTKAEKEAAVAKITKSYENATGAKYYPNMSEIASDSEGTTVRAMFGFDEHHGYSNGMEALRKGKELFPEHEVQIFSRNKNGGIVPAKTLSGPGEYFIQASKRSIFDKNDVLTFPDNGVNHRGIFGFLPKSPAAKFADELSDVTALLPGLEKKVQTDILSVLKPNFVKLAPKSKNRIVEALVKGYKEGRVFQYEELINIFSDGAKTSKQVMQEIKGYYAIRGVNDLHYVIENRKVYKGLAQEGYRYIQNTKNGYKGIARNVTEAEAKASAKTAFDPLTGQITALNADDIATLYKNGDTIGYMWGKEAAGEHITNYVILSGKSGTKLQNLPAKVLNYDPGYLTRLYKTRYFVDEESTRIVNGVRQPYTRTVHSLSTEREALDMIEELRKTEKSGKISYTARLDRNLANRDIERAEKHLRMQKGGLFISGRGERLTSNLGLAEIADPIEALLKTVNTVSRHASHTDVLASMKQKWLNTYGGMFKGKFPEVANDFKVAAARSIENEKAVKDAKAYWQLYNVLANVDSSGKLINVRGGMTRFGEWIMGKGNNAARTWAGNKVIDAASFDPWGRVRGLSFNLYLAANPLRQAVVQSSQYMFLASIDPKFTTFVFSKNGLARQKVGLDLGMAAYSKPELFNKIAPHLAKATGMSVDEYKSLVNEFRRSGLPFSIDSHTFVRDALEDFTKVMHKNDVTRRLDQLFTLPRKAVGVARKVGFDWGEYNNLSSTWLFARNQFIKQNPKANWRNRGNLDKIAANSRNYALNMTKAGSFAYQREGVLSVITQFLSIQHKAVEAMLPAKLGGSKFFTAAEKRRIAVGQTLLYGLSGLGLSEGYKEVRDRFGVKPNKEVDKMMTGGLSEFVLNKTLQSIYEDDTEVRIAKDLAPASGILETNLQKALIDLFTGGSLPTNAVPAGTGINRIYQAIKYGQHMNNAPHIDTTDKLKETLTSSMGIFSGYNNYLKSQAALNLGHMVDSTGDPIVEATYAEAMAKLFGFQSGEVADYYDVMQASMKDISGPRQEKKIKEIAQTYYDNLSKRVAFFNEDMPETLDEVYFKRLEEAIQTEAMILAVLNPMDAEAVLAEFREILGKEVMAGKDRLISGIARAAIGNQYGDSGEYVVNRLRNSGLLTDPDDEEALKEIYTFMTKEKEEMEAINAAE